MRKLITTAVLTIVFSGAFSQQNADIKATDKQKAVSVIKTCSDALAAITFTDKQVVKQKAVTNGVYKLSEQKQADGITQVYLDVKGNTRDTIYVFIPFEAKKEDTSKAVATANK